MSGKENPPAIAGAVPGGGALSALLPAPAALQAPPVSVPSLKGRVISLVVPDGMSAEDAQWAIIKGESEDSSSAYVLADTISQLLAKTNCARGVQRRALTIVLNDRFGVRVERSFATVTAAAAQNKAQNKTAPPRAQPKVGPKLNKSVQAAKQLKQSSSQKVDLPDPKKGQINSPQGQPAMVQPSAATSPQLLEKKKHSTTVTVESKGSATAENVSASSVSPAKQEAKKKSRSKEELALLDALTSAKQKVITEAARLSVKKLPEVNPLVVEYRLALRGLSSFREKTREKDAPPKKGGSASSASSSSN